MPPVSLSLMTTRTTAPWLLGVTTTRTYWPRITTARAEDSPMITWESPCVASEVISSFCCARALRAASMAAEGATVKVRITPWVRGTALMVLIVVQAERATNAASTGRSRGRMALS